MLPIHKKINRHSNFTHKVMKEKYKLLLRKKIFTYVLLTSFSLLFFVINTLVTQ